MSINIRGSIMEWHVSIHSSVLKNRDNHLPVEQWLIKLSPDSTAIIVIAITLLVAVYAGCLANA